ncbi:telomere-capping, CST complex subunit-domain-containing protein [Radiomyces spectabilis]|uniref:telomere-capping, CST complex subunit-domain-containing protein n=1 Tax=Radiomyces spectabilis TaxID=64574 RepID=UPI00221F9364|nr:telomere-capping, CST complex subunit-domain-containing protein [Radiomyces spectabilis]KAI8376472.1 telomere-capping, CST complex subunit-domain-containing protein [Radiomyces spectabilis]
MNDHIPSGQLVLLQDLADNPEAYNQTSIRATGLLRSYRPECNEAIIEHEGSILRLMTDLIIPFPFETNALIQCIGEVHLEESNQELVLRPRIVRNVDTLDMKLYKERIQLSRKLNI